MLQLVTIDCQGTTTPHRFGFGQVKEMVALAAESSRGGSNVYIETRTVSPRLQGRARGTIEATGFCYALVIDSDADKDKVSAARLEPSALIGSGGLGNEHTWLLFDRPTSWEEAEELGARLKAACGDVDGCTGVVTTPFRVPGTVNFPYDPKKIARGRVPAPTTLTFFGDRTWSPDELREVLPELKATPPREPNSDGDARPVSFEEAVSALNACPQPTDDYEYLRNMGFAFADAAGGDKRAFDAYSKWAGVYFTNRGPRECKRLWKTFLKPPRTGLRRGPRTKSSLFKTAFENDWDKPYEDYKANRAAGVSIDEILDDARDYADQPESAESPLKNGKTDDIVGFICRDDFVAYMPQHTYIFIPTREPWPAASVNARLGKKTNKWLDQHKPVEQMTWAPGEPLLIPNRLTAAGGWIEKPGATCFNLYRPPTIKLGDPNKVEPWLAHGRKIYPITIGHIIKYLAYKVQHPEDKINHALVLGGVPGIGKDTLLEAVKYAIGHWNFSEPTPTQVMGRFHPFVKAVIMRVSEAHDLGEVDRFAFYEHMKTLLASPPDVLLVDEKNLREHYVQNVCGTIITTNYRTEALYLPANDRRHHVSWSDVEITDFEVGYWSRFWHWYMKEGGIENVAAYLKTLDLSDFDPKAPPEKTEAFCAIVNANRSSEDAEFADVLDALRNPHAVTLSQIIVEARKCQDGFSEWLSERKNRRVIPHRLEKCGYVPVRNSADKVDGLWKVRGKRQVIYGRKELTLHDQLTAVRKLIEGR